MILNYCDRTGLIYAGETSFTEDQIKAMEILRDTTPAAIEVRIFGDDLRLTGRDILEIVRFRNSVIAAGRRIARASDFRPPKLK